MSRKAPASAANLLIQYPAEKGNSSGYTTQFQAFQSVVVLLLPILQITSLFQMESKVIVFSYYLVQFV